MFISITLLVLKMSCGQNSLTGAVDELLSGKPVARGHSSELWNIGGVTTILSSKTLEKHLFYDKMQRA